MSYELRIKGEDPDTGAPAVFGPFLIGSPGEWGDLCAWAESRREAHPFLADFAANGEYSDTGILSLELEEASKDAPLSGPLRGTIDKLIELIGMGDEGETVEVFQ